MTEEEAVTEVGGDRRFGFLDFRDFDVDFKMKSRCLGLYSSFLERAFGDSDATASS